MHFSFGSLLSTSAGEPLLAAKAGTQGCKPHCLRAFQIPDCDTSAYVPLTKTKHLAEADNPKVGNTLPSCDYGTSVPAY